MTWACAVLLLGEILMPGLVLPFLNLHLFVAAVLVANLIPFPLKEMERPWLRLLAVAPVACVLIGYVWLALSGHGPSALLLALALIILILAASLAITLSYAKH